MTLRLHLSDITMRFHNILQGCFVSLVAVPLSLKVQYYNINSGFSMTILLKFPHAPPQRSILFTSFADQVLHSAGVATLDAVGSARVTFSVAAPWSLTSVDESALSVAYQVRLNIIM